MGPGRCDHDARGRGCVQTDPHPLHALYEGDPDRGRLNQNLRTLPRELPAQCAASHGPPAPSLPSLSTHSPPGQASRPPRRIPRTRRAVSQPHSPASPNTRRGAEASLPLPVGSESSVGEAAKSSVHKTKSGCQRPRPQGGIRDHSSGHNISFPPEPGSLFATGQAGSLEPWCGAESPRAVPVLEGGALGQPPPQRHYAIAPARIEAMTGCRRAPGPLWVGTSSQHRSLLPGRPGPAGSTANPVPQLGPATERDPSPSWTLAGLSRSRLPTEAQERVDV